MSVDFLLKNGIMIVEGSEVLRSVSIKADKIEGIHSPGTEPPARTSVDCTGLYVLPGMVDIHVHLRDMNRTDKEDFETGTMAAAAGGVTTVLDMPNSDPPVLEFESLQAKIEKAQKNRYVNVGFYSGVPRNVKDFDARLVRDVLGIKVYPHTPLVKGVRYTRSRIRDCMKLSSEYGLPLMFHPDASQPSRRPKKSDEYFALHSCESETASVIQFIEALSEVGGHLHACHVSCAATARVIASSRAEESLTAEVTPHHLLLSSNEFSHIDGTAKMLPPLRSPHDRMVLLDMLCSRCAIDCIASDHAPHTSTEKTSEFMKASAGIPGLDTTVPLILTEVFEGRLSWVDYLRVCCSAPARIVGIDSKGILAPGFDADLVVVERSEYAIKGSSLRSKSKVTPFEGKLVKAKPVMTIVGGQIVYEYGEFVISPGTAGRVPVRKH